MTVYFIGQSFVKAGKEHANECALTHEDTLWAARGCVGEGGVLVSHEMIAAYCWTIMRRRLSLPAFMGTKLSYGDLWQKFSQPINPRWTAEGDMCRPGGRYHGRPECALPRLNRRRKIRALTESDLGRVLLAVQAFSAGVLPQHPLDSGWTNWASYPGVEERFPGGVDVSGEWFFRDNGAKHGEIRIENRT